GPLYLVAGHRPLSDGGSGRFCGRAVRLARRSAARKGLMSDASLIALLRTLVAERPDAPILLDANADDARVTDRRALWRRIVTLRRDLEQHGVGDGACVAVWLPNWSDVIVWQFASISLGAHVIGVNTRYNVEEVAHILTLARPAVVAVAHDFVGLD